MATDHFATQAPFSFQNPDTKVPHDIASDVFNFYPTPDAWVSTTSDNQLHATEPDYLRFSVSCMDTALESQLDMSNTMSSATTMANSIENVPCSSPSMFKTVSHPTYGRNTTAVAPQHTILKLDSSSPNSYTNANVDPNRVQMLANSSQSRDSEHSTYDKHSTSSQKSLDPRSPPKKKRRGGRKSSTEDVDLDPARATYLEKNRKAASKCRSKQKRQQDDLVEQAREIERRNKLLKAEVAMLQGGMRELMDMVGQHDACSDTRLKRYVQREADRLADGISRTHPFVNATENLPTGHY
jgi:cyclic AMP-dependent transcription factor ATF-2